MRSLQIGVVTALGPSGTAAPEALAAAEGGAT